MLSALILTRPSYPAVPLKGQRVHQRSIHPGPLVLGMCPRKFRTPTADKDQTVSRRFEPSSRTTLICEQHNPWELLHPQDVMSRHRTFIHTFIWRRLYLLLISDFRLVGHNLLFYIIKKLARVDDLSQIWLCQFGTGTLLARANAIHR
jgi:hypothetical protein